jgi:PAS domain S-box-containing protein
VSAFRPAGVLEHASLDLDVLIGVFESSPDGMLVGDPKGRIFAANPAACDLFGASEDDLRRVGRQGLSDPDHPDWRTLLQVRSRTGQAIGVVPMRRLDGAPFLGEVETGTFHLASGLTRVCVIVRDVTARVHETRRLAAYDDIAEALLGGADIPAVLALVARHARIIFDARATSISAHTEHRLVVLAAAGPRGPDRTGRSYPLQGAGPEAVAAGDSQVIADFTAVAQSGTGRSLGIGPAMILPLAVDGHTFGSLFVGRARGAAPYRPDDLAEAERFGARAAFVLAQGRARAEAEHHQRQTAEQLEQALQSRIRIEQAKGFVAAARVIDPAEAFERIRSYARNHNLRINDVAASIVDRTLQL